MKNSNIKRLLTISAFSIFVVTLTFAPLSASAQIYNSQYQPTSVNELIAYLYGVIASLEAQKVVGTTDTVNRHSNNSSNTNVNRADVETLSATSIKKNGATLQSDIEFGNASYVYAYFDYSTTRSVDQSTNEKKIIKKANFTHGVLLDDLETDTTYYYRAVIELPGGSKVYGSLRNFTTDKTTNSTNSNNYNSNDNIRYQNKNYR